MEEKLKPTFANVDDRVKFAEIKSACLIPFDDVFIFATLAYLKADGNKWYLRYYVYNLVIFQALALIEEYDRLLSETTGKG